MMNTNPELVRERANCPFNKEEITNLLDGGPEATEERRKITRYFLNSEAAKDDGKILESMSSTERYDYDIKKSVALYKTAMKLTEDEGSLDGFRNMLGAAIGSAITPDGNPIGLHFIMFIPTLMGQASQEQLGEWMGKAWNMEIIGTYAQTEMGHGTFIRGLETTATYDAETEEFVLHSPSITAYKWWPGGLGKTANHAVVMCQLVINGEKKGPHPFIVQLRDTETHIPLKGIQIGEIGPKLGMNSNDNGFLGFNYHRIPRDRLLNKNAQVEADGTYVRPPHDKLSYATMIFVRVSIVQDAATHLRKAVTIATRYSAIRRQSELRPGEPEPQIMAFQTQQWKLFPYLALSLGFHFAAQNLWNSYHNINAEIEDGNFEGMPELHALSSGLKALVTAESCEGIDVLRRACGGHGFMTGSNLPRLWGLVAASCTYEGENTVLQLQVARFLYKNFLQSRDSPSKPLPKSVSYLHFHGSTGIDLDSSKGLVNLFSHVAKGHLIQASSHLASLKKKGLHPSDAWNACSLEFSQVSLSHLRYFVISEFAAALKEKAMSKPVKKVMTELMELLAMFWITRHSGDFMRYAKVQGTHMSLVHRKITKLLARIRPNAVSLVDSFDFPDESLKSTLGSFDGNVYERMLDQAKKGALNKDDVQPSFEKYLKPLMNSNL